MQSQSTSERGTLVNRFWAKVRKGDGCWLWIASTAPTGYGRIQRGRRGEGVVLAHRLSWELTYGPIPAGLFVCHHCDTRACVRPDHLFLGTDDDNKVDKSRKGTWPCGSEVRQAKLNEAQVSEIRRRYAAGGIRQIDLAIAYGVADSLISCIINRVYWRHIP